MACPDANRMQAFLTGRLTRADATDLEQHLATCEDCHTLVAALGRAAAPSSDGAPLDVLASTLPELRGHDRAPLAAGTAVGRYRVTGVIGSGGMGVVYAAEDPKLGRRVALKLLRTAGEGSEGVAAQARLGREAQAMARVSHPNVIAVHDVGTYQGRVFLAMELVEGTDLRGWVRAAPRTARQIVDVFMAAGRGLAAAHAAGLVHRDFKPDNVLVGADSRVRVTDFGLARTDDARDAEVSPGEEASTALEAPLTRTGALVGTPAYMAPEQLGRGHVDVRSDQFAYGVALHEALYGQRPFEGKTFGELRAAVLAGKVRPPPRGVRVPETLRAIVLRALAVRPGDRFASVDLLLTALGRDRKRVPRALAWTALVGLLVVGLALVADLTIRDRALAVTRATFAAARDRLGRALELRQRAFVALSDLSTMVPVLREVAGARDDADFGLARATDDVEQLRALHGNLVSADWIAWAEDTGGSGIAVADYKGRLLYTSADHERYGDDVRVVPALAAQYGPEAGPVATTLLRGDDPTLAKGGLLGAKAPPPLVVLLARATVLGGRTRAVFVQLSDAARLLDDVYLGEGTQLALVATDGTALGDVPPAVLAAERGASSEPHEVVAAGEPYLVQSLPLAGGAGDAAIGRFVLAHRLDIGLAGLFPGARLVLGLLAALLVLVGAVAGWRARPEA